jgi:serine/threonine protein kinase
VIEGMVRLRSTDPGQLGPYRLLGLLGDGTTGTVYLSRGSPQRGARKQLAAVRAVRPELLRDRQLRARLRHELQAAQGDAGSRYVASALGCELDSERPWIASDFVPGPSLAELVTRHGPLPERALRALAGALFQALAALHAAHVTHRDLRPCNILLSGGGPRAVDFGLGLSRTDPIVAEDGPAGDVFELGVSLVIAACARHPFSGSMLPSAREDPDLTGVPERLCPALIACLHKVPHARPGPLELARAFDLEDTAGLPIAEWLPEPHLQAIANVGESARRMSGRRLFGR